MATDRIRKRRGKGRAFAGCRFVVREVPQRAYAFAGMAAMADQQIRFSDGSSYDAMMGGWSRSVGELFLEWMRPRAGLDWVDVGCGSGAFTSLVIQWCKPNSILGVDPSEAQLDFARTRNLGAAARFARGDAMALDLADGSVDVAVGALVLHFIPNPDRGVAEMTRVVRPGGLVGAYAWDLASGGFPYDAVHRALRSLGLQAPDPPHPEAGNTHELERLWMAASLVGIEQRVITVSRTFQDIDEYWRTATKSPRVAMALQEVPPHMSDRVMKVTQGDLPQAPNGTLIVTARANAIVGVAPPP